MSSSARVTMPSTVMPIAPSLPARPPIGLPTETSGVPPITTPPQARRKRKQVWLALHFADWPLHVALQGMPLPQREKLTTQPLAVLDQDRQRHVLAANRIAVLQGVRPGHTLNAALALCSQLQLLSRDITKEHKLLNELAAWALRFTPVVNVEAPNELLLEVRGSLHLFGGAAALLQTIERELRLQQLSARMALSSTPRASLCLTRAQRAGDNAMQRVTPTQLKATLSALSLRCLHWPETIETRLARFGILRLGELWRLPRADLARRIGVKYLRELDALLGRHVELRSAYKITPVYRDRMLLDFEMSSTQLLEQVLLSALQRLQQYLREHDLALSRVSIELKHRELESTRLTIGLATPTAEMKRVAGLLHERLQRLILPEPVVEIKLCVKQLLAAQGRVADMLAGITQQRPAQSQLDLLGRLLERLQIRLGKEAIQRLRLHADHRPEYAQCKSPATLQSEASIHEHLPACMSRPLWLLAEPQALPVHSKSLGDLQLIQGPERIESGWWNDAPIKRDYYIARTQHRSCWVFKDLLSPSGWFVHGWFG